MEFFKVYIVKDDLVTIWERDCVKLTEEYAFVRALLSAGTCYNWRICLSMVSDRYFRTLKEARITSYNVCYTKLLRFQMIVNGFKPFAKKCLILSGHVNDKLINKDGEEVSEMQLDLAGKLARIMYSKADAVGLMHRKGNKVFINFDGGGEAIVEARAEHLAGKEILLTEKLEDRNNFV